MSNYVFVACVCALVQPTDCSAQAALSTHRRPRRAWYGRVHTNMHAIVDNACLEMCMYTRIHMWAAMHIEKFFDMVLRVRAEIGIGIMSMCKRAGMYAGHSC